MTLFMMVFKKQWFSVLSKLLILPSSFYFGSDV